MNQLITWNQLREMEAQNRFNQFLGEFPNRMGSGEIHSLAVADCVLCVFGERKSVKEDQKRKFHRIERSYGNFRRSFTLPEDADSKKVTADFRDGVLKVHLPTTPIARSKAIEVKVT